MRIVHIIDPHGDSVCYADRPEPEAYVSLILQLLQDEGFRRSRVSAAQQVLANLTPERTIEKVLGFYDRLLVSGDTQP